MKKGVSFIEMLICIAFLGIFSAVVFTLISQYKAADSLTEQARIIEQTLGSRSEAIKDIKRQKFEVSEIFEVDGTKVYRFRDKEVQDYRWHYLTVSSDTNKSTILEERIK